MNFIPYMIMLSTIPSTAILVTAIRDKKWIRIVAASATLVIAIAYIVYKLNEEK